MGSQAVMSNCIWTTGNIPHKQIHLPYWKLPHVLLGWSGSVMFLRMLQVQQGSVVFQQRLHRGPTFMGPALCAAA
jgi:hypothetical protein